MQTQQTKKVEIILKGGPAVPDTKYQRMAEMVKGWVQNTLEYLAYDGAFILFAVEARKGGSQQQGIRAQKYDNSELRRPLVYVLAQTHSNDSCWLWTIQFPPNTDAISAFGNLSIAFEEGRYGVKAVQLLTNVVELRPLQLPVMSESVEVKKAQHTVEEVLADTNMLACLLASVFVQVAIKGRGRTIHTDHAITEIVAQMDGSFLRRDASRIVAAFIHREWVKSGKNERRITFTSKGIELLSKGGVQVSEVAEVTLGASVNNTPIETPVTDVALPALSFKDHIRGLAEKVRKYDEAKKQVAELNASVDGLNDQLKKLEERKEQILKLISEQAALLMTGQSIVNDKFYSDARDELEQYRRDMTEVGV